MYINSSGLDSLFIYFHDKTYMTLDRGGEFMFCYDLSQYSDKYATPGLYGGSFALRHAHMDKSKKSSTLFTGNRSLVVP